LAPTPRAPIIEALRKYIANGTVRFHMPGHKGGIRNSVLTEFLGNEVFAADVTNVPGLDDLHQAHGVIKEAQDLAARTFGAEYTYFLVNGSSCGLQALVTAVCNPGDRILVPRNLHRSILSGIILSGAVPAFFLPEYDYNYGIPLGTLAETIQKSLAQNPDTKAVLLVNPTYHGVTSNISVIAEIVHNHNIPLLVDEAHGPHLGFHEDLPPSSLRQGADAVVHGTHKILTAFTQASMLHLQGNLINRQRLEAALKLLQSTSTSYLLLASLDAARADMDINGKQLLRNCLELSRYLRENIRKCAGLAVFEEEMTGRPGVFGLDPIKITISVKELEITGIIAEQWLRDHFDIQVEMSDLFNLLLIVGPGNSREDADCFLKALETMIKAGLRNLQDNSIHKIMNSITLMPDIPELVVSPREAFFSQAVSLPLREAVGRICSETVACYPPGIPIICPGEIISKDIADYLVLVRDAGVHMQGCSDPSLQNILVVKE